MWLALWLRAAHRLRRAWMGHGLSALLSLHGTLLSLHRGALLGGLSRALLLELCLRGCSLLSLLLNLHCALLRLLGRPLLRSRLGLDGRTLLRRLCGVLLLRLKRGGLLGALPFRLLRRRSPRIVDRRRLRSLYRLRHRRPATGR